MLTAVIAVPLVFAFPDRTVEGPTLYEALLLPESVERVKEFPTVALLFCAELSVVAELLFELLVELVPLPVMEVFDGEVQAEQPPEVLPAFIFAVVVTVALFVVFPDVTVVGPLFPF